MTETTTLTRREDRYVEAFERWIAEGWSGPSWFRPIREEAIRRFAELGFPTPKHEDWKFTNVAPVAEAEFVVEPGVLDAVAASDIRAFRLPGAEGTRLVFVNGRYSDPLSSISGLPDGVRVASLAQVMESDRGSIETHLARYADYHNDAFTALNTAFARDGGFVSIPDHAIVEHPIHLLFVTTAASGQAVTNQRNLIVAGEDCQAAIVEEYVSLTDGVYFSNAVTEVVAGDNAVLGHTVIERESPEAFGVSTLRVQQGRFANVTSHTVLLGGRLIRNNVHPVLAGEGGYCMINGLFIPRGRQHMDNFMRVEHAAPHGDSRQFYNGILDDDGRGVFAGRIVVHQAAQKTDAKQENRNVLLSESAQVNSKPQLEIYADDVKCTHGATIGQLDEEAVFYLRSRGIPNREARRILLLGFAGECIGRIKVESVREYVDALVRERVPG